jgi:hypothetical protein
VKLTIDIYSRVDGALVGLLAFHLKSCDSVDYRPTAGRVGRLPASETRGGSVWPQPEVHSADGLLQARKIACLNGGEPLVMVMGKPLLILKQNSAHFNAGADKLQTSNQNFN